MTPFSLIDKVADVLREAAATAIMPRFQALATHEIEEKSPGELVTVADRESEVLIARGLAALLPGSRVIGEEACSVDPTLIETIDEGDVWIVDPLDGTANFAAGTEVFAVMAALLRNGETVAGWILSPVSGLLSCAEQGSGAWLNGNRLIVPESPFEVSALRGSIGRFMAPEMLADIAGRAGDRLLPGLMCAGAEYPLIATGERDFALYWRTLAWDHAPGVLLINEAGGKATRPDGSPYVPGSPGMGLLAAHTPDKWEAARRLLLG